MPSSTSRSAGSRGSSRVTSRVFGAYWPGRFGYGSFLDRAVRQLLFAAVNGRKPRGLEVRPDGARYTRLIVSLDHPDTAKTALTA